MNAPEHAPIPWADLPAFRARHREQNPIPAIETLVAALAERRQWLMWRYEPGEAKEKKPRKMPYYASGKRRVGVQGDEADRAALADYATVAASAAKRGFDGVGFAFLPGDGLIGIDLDGMIDPETGDISERCAQIIAACATYTEYSPSGKGVHIIGTGESETFKSNDIGVEVFAGRQYFTFTGRVWPGSTASLNEIPEKTLRRLRSTVDAAKGKARKPPAAPQDSAPRPPAGPYARSLAETVANTEEALQHLSPDDYEQWIAMGHACKEGLGSAGYIVWDAWSSKSPKYAGQDDTDSRWKGFNPSKTTLGALFKRAEEAGWEAPWTKARRKRKPKADLPVEEAPDMPPAPPAESEPPSPPNNACAGGGGEDPDEWKKRLLRTKNGDLRECVMNVHDILLHSARWEAVIAFDEFAQRTIKLKPPPFFGGEVGEWEAVDDTQTAMWLSRAWRFAPATPTVAEAIETLARARTVHPVRDWLRSLDKWDGIHRIDRWLSDFCGVKDSEYVRLVSRFFLIGMVARVMVPGVKFDYCLVLEGKQGKGKSTIVRILGGEWHGDTDLDLHNKDSMSALRGKWVYEFAEMGSVTRAESTKQKSFLSRQFDEFRPVYGRREIRLARQVVFIGTTNEWEWNKDPTGGRRFWPVDCSGEFNLDGLRSMREQLFAEAVAAFDAGDRFYPSPEEQQKLFDPEQLMREQQESLVDALHDWVYQQVAPFSVADAAMTGLGLDASKLTRDLQTRLGNALRKLGCTKFEKRNGMVRYWYNPPKAAMEQGVHESGTQDAKDYAKASGGNHAAPF